MHSSSSISVNIERLGLKIALVDLTCAAKHSQDYHRRGQLLLRKVTGESRAAKSIRTLLTLQGNQNAQQNRPCQVKQATSVSSGILKFEVMNIDFKLHKNASPSKLLSPIEALEEEMKTFLQDLI